MNLSGLKLRIGVGTMDSRGKIISSFYVIKIDNRPIYIGYTNRNYLARFKEHIHQKDLPDTATIELVDTMSFDFTWDEQRVSKNAKAVSNMENYLIRKFNTTDSEYQKGIGNNLGGQTWNSVKSFVRSNKNNPRYISMSNKEILEYLENYQSNRKYLGHFISNMDRPESIYLQKFIIHMERTEYTYLRNFVIDMNRPEATYIRSFISHIERTEARYIKDFVSHIDRPESTHLKSFVSNMYRPEDRYLKSFIHDMNRLEFTYLKGFISHMDRAEGIYLSNFIKRIERTESTYISNFINRIERPESVYISNFIGRMK